MVRTRKRFYGEEKDSSQSSSNIAYTNRSRLKQEGKRQRKTKQQSLHICKMSDEMNELLNTLSGHNATFVHMLYEVCLERGFGPDDSVFFWPTFAEKLCLQIPSLVKSADLTVVCTEHYRSLKTECLRIQGEGSSNLIASLPPTCWELLKNVISGQRSTNVVGGWRSTSKRITSKRRSSRSTRSASSVGSGFKLKEIRGAIGELARSDVLDFDDIERFEQYITQSNSRLQVFMDGDLMYRSKVVSKFHQTKNIDSQETHIPNSY